MANEHKCPKCGKINSLDNSIKYKNRYYCKSCYELILKEKDEKANKTSNKKPKASQESSDYTDLINYIFKMFDLDSKRDKSIIPLLCSQIKYFKNTYGCTYQGMKATLYYYYEVLLMNPPNPPSLGFIPFYYYDTERFYKDKVAIKKSMSSSNTIPIVIVNINEEEKDKYNESYEEKWRAKENMIDISEIGVDDNDD